MSDYPAGSMKRHPDWPNVPQLVMRTDFIDGQFPGWTSWMRFSPSGSEFVTAESVENWPDVAVTDQT